MKKNCWELKKCGREPDGKNAKELGVCPATILTEYDGINHGKNAGRICWIATGTLCGGVIQGTFAQKEGSCLACDFFNTVSEEEGFNFKFTHQKSESFRN